MKKDSWSQFPRRVSRRRSISTAAGAALGAALLAACGGDAGEQTSTTGLLTRAVDTSKQAKRGGTLKVNLSSDVGTFDPHFTQVSNNTVKIMSYNALLGLKPGILEPLDGSIAGVLAESWELSPDKLTLTMKLRPSSAFAPLPPVNGRLLDSGDVLYSWERFAKVGSSRTLLANSANPDAPVLSMTAPDTRTVTIKLSEPAAAVLSSFATTTALLIIPKDIESQGIDLRNAMIGTGAFYRTDYVPSSRVVFKRNPGFYNKERPFVDTVELPIISEYAAGLAQFRAGALHTFAVRPEEVIALRRELPALAMYQDEMATPNLLAFFGWRPASPEKTPFRDVRVRQAFSMSWDRDLFIDVVYNVEKSRNEGVAVETAWNTCIWCTSYRGWWVDPRSKEFGENGRYFEKNIAEAKKLLAAAGYPNGLDIVSNHETGTGYGINFPRQVEILLGMTQEAGFRATINPVGFNTNWVPEFRDARGNFEGMSWRSIAADADIGNRMYDEFSTKGNRFTGFDPEGKGTFAGDPFVEELLLKMRREFDDAKRKEYAIQIQRHFGKMMYIIRNPGGATSLSLAWPALKNYRVHNGEPIANLHYWLDDSLPPFRPT